MPELKMKIGLVSCSGEEMAEGTVTRLATLKVLETLRPGETVTICLPLFLAGGEGDREFARTHPTITIDGCGKRCAAKGTERYSSSPAASIVVTERCNAADGFGTARHLNEAGLQAVETIANDIAIEVDRLLGTAPERHRPSPASDALPVIGDATAAATCSCGSGVPAMRLEIAGRRIEALALPLIFEKFRQAGRAPGLDTTAALMDAVGIYNSVPDDEQQSWKDAIEREYAAYCERKER